MRIRDRPNAGLSDPAARAAEAGGHSTETASESVSAESTAQERIDSNSRRGLSNSEAAARLRRDGPNLLPQPDRRRHLAIVLDVLREPMLLLLMGAAVVYLLLGDAQQAAVLGVSVLLVIALTIYQEQKSERALQALRDLSSPRARVLRDGQAHIVAARDLVLGDVILVAEGDRVPADARVLDEFDLHVDESMLTGESVPVHRGIAEGAQNEDGVLRASTLVVRGRGTAEVIATGSATAVGKIGLALRTIHPEPTPMQREMRRAVMLFSLLGLASCVLVVTLYVTTRGNWLQALLAGITLAISNIPEEFPVVLTVFMALGAWRMARHQALVRRAPAIEALGAVTVLCTDKTGTLTENRMSLAELRTDNECSAPTAPLSPALAALLECADRASPDLPHDPMERAIRTMAAHLPASTAGDGWQRVHEYPLSTDLLACAHVWRAPQTPELIVACKGAPETVAQLCALNAEQRTAVSAQVEAMASRGLRVIAAAQAIWHDNAERFPASASHFRFVWRGLLGLADPLREGVPEAVAQARAAGVRVVMLTGDHLQTARAIAVQAGLAGQGEAALGRELDALDGTALAQRVAQIDVFARVKPEHKLRLVRALKQAGEVVAMTGDGVNDAPALMAAHVGVAMGGRGTDVAREAAAIVLLDDNFVTVVRAIGLGRTIYDNIVRAVRFIMAVHVPITGLALLPLLAGGPLMLLPLHVVFLEMIVDPACSIVFEREAPAPDAMTRPPRPPSQHLLDTAILLGSLAQGLAVFLAVAAIYFYGRSADMPAAQLAALSFTALVAGNLGLIAINRSGPSFWRSLLQPNPAFWIVTLMALSLLMAITRFQAPGHWFGFAPPPIEMSVVALLLPQLALGLLMGLQYLHGFAFGQPHSQR